MSGIVLFDGMCHFCDSSVQFVIKRDLRRHFKFASLQGEIGQRLLNEYDVNKDTDSFVLIDQGKAYVQSTAALKMCRYLRFPWKILYAFLLVPRPIRNFFYNIVAKNRYRWFDKKETCTLPTVEDKKRFL